MPHRPPSHPDCLHFAQLLRVALAKVGLRDAKLIGELVSAAQEFPLREDIPYHPAVVRSWLDGNAVPPPQAMEALHAMLSDVTPAAFEDAYEAAFLQAPMNNEIGTVLRHRMQRETLGLKGFSKKLHEHGISGQSGKPFAAATVSKWCNGINAIPTTTLAAIDQLLPPQESERVSLGKLHPLYAPDPQDMLTKATTTSDLNSVLYCMRKATGLTQARMAAAISKKLPGDGSISGIGVLKWELPRWHQNATFPSKITFGDTHPMDAYLSVMADHGFADWAWDSATRERVHSVYARAVGAQSRQELFQFIKAVAQETPSAPQKAR